jgi:hypothetical protein
VALANTLHEIGALTDAIFDQLIIDIYTKYGEEYYAGDASFSDDTIRMGQSINSCSTAGGDVDDTVGLPMDREKGQE